MRVFTKISTVMIIVLFVNMALAAPKHFREGATGRIKCDQGIFDFSEDGTCLWVVSEDSKTNCYSLVGKKINETELVHTSPPLERLTWWCKFPSTNDLSRLKRDGFDNLLLPNFREVNNIPRMKMQIYPTGNPRFYIQGDFDTDGNLVDYWENRDTLLCSNFLVQCKTDLNTFRIEQIIPCDQFVWLMDMRVSMSGTNYILQDYNFDNQNDELYFHSGKIKNFGKSFKKKAKCLTLNDMRRIADDGNIFKVNLGVFFLSENIAAVAPSSAEGRNTFVGRGYLLLYDFRTNKVFWSRKSDREFLHWNKKVSVLYDDAVLSADERHLAVRTGGVIYIYKDFMTGKEL